MKAILSLILLIVTTSVLAQQNISDSLLHQNIQRKFITHLPPGYVSNQSLPLVLVLHGGSGNNQSVQGFTEMNQVSNQNNFIAVYPKGEGIAPPGFSWADGRGTTADIANIDDVGFISKLIDKLRTDFNIDTNKVYVCGYSNGGFMTQRLACEIPEKFAAIGALGCSMDINLIQNCHPSRPVPMAYFSGTNDPEVPYHGGAMNNPNVTPIVPIDTAVQYWVSNNNCQDAQTVVQLPNTNLMDSSTVELYKFTDCDCDADFYFYKIINGGHTWPGVPIAQFPQLGNTNEDIHASYVLWNFFDKFSTCSNITSTLSQFEDVNIKVYPNPTSNFLTINSTAPIENIFLYDITGRLIFTSQQRQIDVRMLTSGLYFIEVLLENKKSSLLKVIKQ